MSTSLKQILVATDFSPAAQQAVQRAAWLAQRHGAQLHLIHAIAAAGWIDEVIGSSAQPGLAGLRPGIAAELEAQLQFLPESVQQRTQLHVLDGPLPQSLPHWCAQRPAADLLVLGACNDAHLRHFLLGSTAHRMLRQAELPVLLVRNQSATAYSKVLLSTDFSESSIQAAELGVLLSAPAQYFLFHADERLHEPQLAFIGLSGDVIEDYRRERTVQSMRQLEQLARRWTDAGHQVLPVLRDAPTSRVLSQIVEEAGIDLIVLGASGHGALARSVLGSVSEEAAASLRCDVLVVRR
jgi:nucleotide-binding universal stress UspA family protein